MNPGEPIGTAPTFEADWAALEAAVRSRNIVLDRPQGSVHPTFPDIRYPLDYGYVEGLLGTDGDGLDVFVGTAQTGLVGACETTDHRKGDRELKLLLDCDPREVYMAYGFLTFIPTLMSARIVMRAPMAELWERVRG